MVYLSSQQHFEKILNTLKKDPCPKLVCYYFYIYIFIVLEISCLLHSSGFYYVKLKNAKPQNIIEKHRHIAERRKGSITVRLFWPGFCDGNFFVARHIG